MSSIIQIIEPENELSALYKDGAPHIKPRINMLLKLKQRPTITKSQLSQELKVSYNSINSWCNLYSNGGIKKLLEYRETRYNNLSKYYTGFSDEVYMAIEKRHKKQPFESYVELHDWMKKNYFPGVKYPTLVRYINSYFGEDLRITGILHVQVIEPLDALERIYSKCMSRLKHRIAMLIEIKKNEKISRKELAHKIGVSYGSILKWSILYKDGGINRLCKYKSSLAINPDVYDFIRKKIECKEFTSNADLYREIQKKLLPDIKYHTLNRYLAKYFANKIAAIK